MWKETSSQHVWGVIDSQMLVTRLTSRGPYDSPWTYAVVSPQRVTRHARWQSKGIQWGSLGSKSRGSTYPRAISLNIHVNENLMIEGISFLWFFLWITWVSSETAKLVSRLFWESSHWPLDLRPYSYLYHWSQSFKFKLKEPFIVNLLSKLDRSFSISFYSQNCLY
jgi:hypothetical protein